MSVFRYLSIMGQIRKWKSLLSRKNILHSSVLLSIILIIPLTISEIYLRIDGELDTYAEKTGHFYRSYYNHEAPSLYWNHPIDTTYTIHQGDFSYEYETNELGLREKRNAISKPDTGAFRILTLGDSFTEGFGTSADSAWPRIFEDWFKTETIGFKKVQVYNAGMAGSDPFFNYVMLKDKLLPFRPNLVIQTVNVSDLSDFLFRGGMERFGTNHIKFRNGPWWEPLFRLSYTFRLVAENLFGYNSMLVSNENHIRIYRESVKKYAPLFSTTYRQLADSVGFSVVYILQPMHSDIQYQNGYYLYMQQLDSLLKESGCISIDLLPAMESAIGIDTAYDYSWKTDGHYRGLGYLKMGELIADTLTKMNFLIPTEKTRQQ